MIDSQYRAVLVKAFRDLYDCEAIYLETVRVDVSKNNTKWLGNVEVFRLCGHPQTARGYAWACDKLKPGDIVALLQLPPVTSPRTAVRVVLAKRVPMFPGLRQAS
jgi:hypothetical protein